MFWLKSSLLPQRLNFFYGTRFHFFAFVTHIVIMIWSRWSIIGGGRNRFFSTMKNFKPFGDADNLFCCDVPIKLNRGETVNVNAVIQDTLPETSSNGTLITIHGAPGSHKDFKYMLPYFAENNIRVIGLNLPGLGYTSYDDRLLNESYERDQFIDGVLSNMGIAADHPLVVAGHSRGSIDAIRLTLRLKRNRRNVRGVVPINLVGFRPHRGIRPYAAVKFTADLWNIRPLRPILSPIFYQFYNRFLNFRSSGEVAAICIQAMANIDFDEQRQFVEELDRKGIQILTTFAGKDSITEVTISREFAATLTDNVELICRKSEVEKQMIDEIRHSLSVHRHVSVNFVDDDHFLQKHRAKILAECIVSMFFMPSIKSFGN